MMSNRKVLHLEEYELAHFCGLVCYFNVSSCVKFSNKVTTLSSFCLGHGIIPLGGIYRYRPIPTGHARIILSTFWLCLDSILVKTEFL